MRPRMLSLVLISLAGAAGLRAQPPAPAKIPPALLEKRLDVAQKVFAQNFTRIQMQQGLPSELFGWSARWLEAELALAKKHEDRVKALRAHLDRTRVTEKLCATFAKTGQGRQADADAAIFFRLDAEIRLASEGVEVGPAKGGNGKPKK